MRMIRNRRAVALRSHSVRFGVLSFLFELIAGLADNWQTLDGMLPISQGWFAGLGIGFLAVAILGRFIDQDL